MLMENPAKIQLAANSKKGKDKLNQRASEKGFEQQIVKENMEILGMTTVGTKARAKDGKEASRIENALRTIRS